MRPPLEQQTANSLGYHIPGIRARELSGDPFIRHYLIHGSSVFNNHLPKSLLLPQSHWGLIFQHVNSGGMHTFNPWHTHWDGERKKMIGLGRKWWVLWTRVNLRCDGNMLSPYFCDLPGRGNSSVTLLNSFSVPLLTLPEERLVIEFLLKLGRSIPSLGSSLPAKHWLSSCTPGLGLLFQGHTALSLFSLQLLPAVALTHILYLVPWPDYGLASIFTPVA